MSFTGSQSKAGDVDGSEQTPHDNVRVFRSPSDCHWERERERRSLCYYPLVVVPAQQLTAPEWDQHCQYSSLDGPTVRDRRCLQRPSLPPLACPLVGPGPGRGGGGGGPDWGHTTHPYCRAGPGTGVGNTPTQDVLKYYNGYQPTLRTVLTNITLHYSTLASRLAEGSFNFSLWGLDLGWRGQACCMMSCRHQPLQSQQPPTTPPTDTFYFNPTQTTNRCGIWRIITYYNYNQTPARPYYCWPLIEGRLLDPVLPPGREGLQKVLNRPSQVSLSSFVENSVRNNSVSSPQPVIDTSVRGL